MSPEATNPIIIETALTVAVEELGGAFCDADKQAEIEDFFAGCVEQLAGGPRNLARTLEGQ